MPVVTLNGTLANRYVSSSTQSDAEAVQGYYGTRERAGRMIFSGLSSYADKEIKSITFSYTASGAGSSAKKYLQLYEYSSSSGNWSGNYIGSFGGYFYNNSSSITAYGAALENIINYIKRGGNTFACWANENKTLSGKSYSANYLKLTRVNLILEYDDVSSIVTKNFDAITLGTNAPITIEAHGDILPSDSVTHRLTVSVNGGVEQLIASNVALGTYNINLAYSFASNISTGKQANAVLYCETYVNGVARGKRSMNVVIKIPDSTSFYPTCNITHTIHDGLSSYAIKGRSTVSWDMSSSTGKYGSTIVSGEITINGVKYTSLTGTSAVLTGSVFSYSGTVTDSRGFTSTVKSYTAPAFLTYSPPVINSAKVVRYSSVENEQGTISYRKDDSGEKVWIEVNAVVSKPSPATNAWSLKISYKNPSTQTTTTKTLKSGTDGTNIVIDKDRTLLTTTISASADCEFTFTLSDQLHTVITKDSIYKASGYFNVEKYGVAVGKRSVGTADNPLFEVAYPMIRYGLYNTNEHVVGSTARNGKDVPVYEQTIFLDGTPEKINNEHYLIGQFAVGSDIDFMLESRYCCHVQNGSWFTSYYLSASWNCGVEINTVSEALFIKSSSSTVVYDKFVVTIRYTRQSDL